MAPMQTMRIEEEQFKAMMDRDPSLRVIKQSEGLTEIYRDGDLVARYLPIQGVLSYVPKRPGPEHGATCATCVHFVADDPDNPDEEKCMCAVHYRPAQEGDMRCFDYKNNDPAPVNTAIPWPPRCPDCGGPVRLKYDHGHEPFWSCRHWDGPRPRLCEGRMPFTLHPEEQAEWNRFVRETPHTREGERIKQARYQQLIGLSIERLSDDTRRQVPTASTRRRRAMNGWRTAYAAAGAGR